MLLSSETNHNVRNSIIGSLKKIKNEPQYRQVIDRLLTIYRNNFIQDYQMKTEVDKVKAEADAALEAFQEGEQKYANSSKKSEQFFLKNLDEEAAKKHGPIARFCSITMNCRLTANGFEYDFDFSLRKTGAGNNRSRFLP